MVLLKLVENTGWLAPVFQESWMEPAHEPEQELVSFFATEGSCFSKKKEKKRIHYELLAPHQTADRQSWPVGEH